MKSFEYVSVQLWILSMLLLSGCRSNDAGDVDSASQAGVPMDSETVDDSSATVADETDVRIDSAVGTDSSSATLTGETDMDTDTGEITDTQNQSDSSTITGADSGTVAQDSATLSDIGSDSDTILPEDTDTDLTDTNTSDDTGESGDSGVSTDTGSTADTELLTDTDARTDTADTAAQTDSEEDQDSNFAGDSDEGNSWFEQYPPAGYANGQCDVPQAAQLDDVSNPTTVIGDGTPGSCTSDAVVDAVAEGGVITFDCGPDPVLIKMEETAKIYNNTGPRIVIDGGGKVVLSGQGERRILYMNTCDQELVWTTSQCQNQDHPQLTIQNLTFVDADSRTETEYDGGGAVWVRGGRLKVANCRFFSNVCADTGQDVGGGAIRATSQYNGEPVYVVNSTFGGSDMLGNVCSNGGALSSIGVSWSIFNSYFSNNRAIGNGGNPAEDNTPGGGSGGAIYNDGNEMTLSICGSRIEYNEVNAYGSAIFFVSNDYTGDMVIDQSVITNNIGGSWYPTYPQISNHAVTPITVTDSLIE